jgi:hypothetical protein
VIDPNGASIRAQNDTKINQLKIEQTSNLLIDLRHRRCSLLERQRARALPSRVRTTATRTGA